MKHKKQKYTILSKNQELELTPNDNFIIKKDCIENYEIIDFHCHSYEGLCQLFQLFLQKGKTNHSKSRTALSCFLFSINLVDLNKVYFSNCPTKLFSFVGFETKIKLLFNK